MKYKYHFYNDLSIFKKKLYIPYIFLTKVIFIDKYRYIIKFIKYF